MITSSERELAEKALAWFVSNEETPEPEWPAVASRIREARKERGLTQVQVAERVGITPPAYADAEDRDDETFTVLSIAEIARLGRALSIPPGKLLFGDSGLESQEVGFAEVRDRLRDQLAISGLGVEGFGEKVGWEVGGVLLNPEALWEFNLVGFRDISKAAVLIGRWRYRASTRAHRRRIGSPRHGERDVDSVWTVTGCAATFGVSGRTGRGGAR
jgi:transcriptional regulator with XRE-family HTH domain